MRQIMKQVSCIVVCCLALSPVFAATLQVKVRDNSNQAILDAVVYVEPEVAAPPAKAQAGIEIEQNGLKFSPLVTVIQVGSMVAFPNNDTVRHHIYSFSEPKKFEQKLYFGDTAQPVVFEKPGTVVLGCNIHDRMLAYIQIVNTPYFGKTDANGNVTLERVPNGKYKLKVWHYNSNNSGGLKEQALQLTSEKQQAEVKLSMKTAVPDSPSSPDSY